MITLLYRAGSVGPVCERVASIAPKVFRVVRDNIPPTGPTDVLVRWGSRSQTHTGATEINTVASVALARNKLAARQVLQPHGLCPKTWARPTRNEITYPCVVRPRHHHAGQDFHVCNTPQERRRASITCGKGWYASELVDKESEYRVFVLQGRVVCMSQRFPANPTDVAWNLARGGRLLNVRREVWPADIARVAVDATRMLRLDWAAMDLCKTKTGATFVFEANTAPGLRNPYTIKKIAKALAKLARPVPLLEGYQII